MPIGFAVLGAYVIFVAITIVLGRAMARRGPVVISSVPSSRRRRRGGLRLASQREARDLSSER